MNHSISCNFTILLALSILIMITHNSRSLEVLILGSFSLQIYSLLTTCNNFYRDPNFGNSTVAWVSSVCYSAMAASQFILITNLFGMEVISARTIILFFNYTFSLISVWQICKGSPRSSTGRLYYNRKMSLKYL